MLSIHQKILKRHNRKDLLSSKFSCKCERDSREILESHEKF